MTEVWDIAEAIIVSSSLELSKGSKNILDRGTKGNGVIDNTTDEDAVNGR